MQTFEEYLSDCGVTDTAGLICFLTHLTGDGDQAPPAEIEHAVNEVFSFIFN